VFGAPPLVAWLLAREALRLPALSQSSRGSSRERRCDFRHSPSRRVAPRGTGAATSGTLPVVAWRLAEEVRSSGIEVLVAVLLSGEELRLPAFSRSSLCSSLER